VRDEKQWEELKSIVKEKWGHFDVLVHSIAYASPDALCNGLSKLQFNDFVDSQNISCFSFIRSIQVFSECLNPASSIITLTNNGSQKVIAGYGVMGLAKASLEASVKYLAFELGDKKIRVNAISAGPVKTMSAMGVNNFNKYLDLVEEKSALKQNITGEDVADLALFLASDLSTKITGTIQFVDAGISVLGG
jgi:enoyl-[acyl-carrier protein] reductase I